MAKTDIAGSQSLMKQVIYQQERAFKSFEFPETVKFVVSKDAEILALGTSKIQLPTFSICSFDSVMTQVTHEVGHLVFAKRFSKGNNAIARDYKAYIQALEVREELYALYDDLDYSAPDYALRRDFINQEIAKINIKTDKLIYIADLIFPLEELFADLYASIFFRSKTAIGDALSCYSAEEARDRDYSTKVPLNYVPLDPYGHSDYLYFGFHFLEAQSLNSRDEQLDLLFRKIEQFIPTVLHDEFDFSRYNIKLLEV